MKKTITGILACSFFISIFVTNALAFDSSTSSKFAYDTVEAATEQLAYMDLELATPYMQEQILEARREVIYHSNWINDKYDAVIMDMDGNVISEIPKFSEVFPGWDLSALDASERMENLKTQDTSSEVGAARTGIFSKEVYVLKATSYKAPPFHIFRAGGLVQVWADAISSSARRVNIGLENYTTGEDVFRQELGTNLSVALTSYTNNDEYAQK